MLLVFKRLPPEARAASSPWGWSALLYRWASGVTVSCQAGASLTPLRVSGPQVLGGDPLSSVGEKVGAGGPSSGDVRAAFPLWSGPSAAPAKGKQVEPFVSLRTFCVTQGSSAQPPHRDLLSPQCQSVLGVPRLLWRGSSGGLSLASLSGVAGGPGLGHEPPSVG